MRNTKNTIPTSFTIDLSTVDKKIDKLLKYFHNSSIDLEDDGLIFKNPETTYKTLTNSLEKRAYKENLSKLINDIYYKRFENTKQNLINQGVATSTDLLIPQPIDDFGSTFDAFAATNTDPDNLVLKILNVKPYKYLKVDIHDQDEIRTYVDNVSSATYDLNNLTFLLNRLDTITYSYTNNINSGSPLKKYINELREKVFLISNTKIETEQPHNYIYNLLEAVPACETAADLMTAYFEDTGELYTKIFPSGTIAFIVDQYGSENIKNVIGAELYQNEINRNKKDYDWELIELAKIKLIDFIIRKEIQNTLQQKINALKFLSDFKSKYSNYNFLEKKLQAQSSVESKIVEKEQLFFKLTFLRETEQVLIQQNEKLFSNLNVEFINKQNLKIESPFGSIDRNNKFVAIIGGTDIAQNYVNLVNSNFFDPTILSILSDIDYIDRNIFEEDPFYCPTPQSLQPQTKVAREEYTKNEHIVGTLTKNKNFIQSNPQAFTYITFPYYYFIPNYFSDPLSLYQSIKVKLTKNKAEEFIKNFSKYSYDSDSETPTANIIRDQNANALFREALLNNGFYGFYEARKDSFADPLSINKIIKQIENLGDNASSQIQSIIFARTNISCLLKEFQTCFMPQIPSCREVLTGFRFSELESIINKAFPESIYPEIYQAIKAWKLQNIRDAREKALLEEINDLEESIKNNERKEIIFREMDRRQKPADALNVADQEIGTSESSDLTLQELYQQKLKEYRDFKLNQESAPKNEIDRINLQRQMNPEEMQMIDSFLDMLQSNGVDISVLCDFGKLITDLTKTSFTFGTIIFPQLPEIDIFQETKLSIDLSVAKLIFDTVVAFILKILNELLTCGGIKDLLEAGITGETSGGFSQAAIAAVNQIATGRFDLDDFVDRNPQIDPTEYKKLLNNLGNNLSNSITLTQESSLTVQADLGIAGNAILDSKSKTIQVLSNPRSSAVTETQVAAALTGLISELSTALKPVQFINLISGKALEVDIVAAAEYIEENKPELLYLSNPLILSSIFKYIGNISGLDSVRDELYAVSSLYSNGVSAQQAACLDPLIPTPTTPREPSITDPNSTEVGSSQQPTVGATDKYRQLLADLLGASPITIKQKVDEEIFKPLLAGMLPNGSKIKNIEKSQKDSIKSTFNDISDKFKANCNEAYSKLAYKKKVERKIPKFLKQEGGDGSKYENPEFKDIISKGGYKEDFNKEEITVEEYRYVYGDVFREYFERSSRNLAIDSNPESLTITLSGLKGYSSEKDEHYYVAVNNLGTTEENSHWKIVSTMNREENKVTLYEGNSREQNKEIFSHTVQNQENFDTNLMYQKNNDSRIEFQNLLKNNIEQYLNISNQEQFDNQFQVYSSNFYQLFLSTIYRKITEAISNDGLLKPINLDSLGKENYIVGIKDGLDSVFPGLSNILSTTNVVASNPNIDTPMKYLNFCPNPTKEQKNLNIDPGMYGKLEIEQFVYEMMNQRQSDLMNLKTLKEMLSDKDNTLKQSMIDGLYLSLMRSACAEVCLRTIFVLRTFKYNTRIIEDLLIPTLVSQFVVDEIKSFSSLMNKESLYDLAVEHVSYTHDFIFSSELENEENDKLFKEIKTLKKQITSLKEDKEILNSYIGKLIVNSSKTEMDNLYKEQIENYVSCLNQEIKDKNEQVLRLQTRNIAYNELLVMFDKLSYITSTNDKVKESFDSSCNDNILPSSNNEKQFLSSLIPEILINSELKEITTETEESIEDFIKKQESKFVPGSQIIMEHFIDIGSIVRLDEDDNLKLDLIERQKQLRCFGATTFKQFLKLLEILPNNSLISDYDFSSLDYGMRAVYIPTTARDRLTQIEFNKEKSITENFDRLIQQNKNVFSIGNNQTYTYQLNYFADYSISMPINRSNKTYSIPFLREENQQGDRKFGLINAIPIIEEKLPIQSIQPIQAFITPNSIQAFITPNSSQIKTIGQLKQFLQDMIDNKPNELKDTLKAKISCDEKLSRFYEVLTNQNMLSNIMTLSSYSILGNSSGKTSIKSSFSNLRYKILNDVFIKLSSIYNEDDFNDLLEKMSSKDYFKQFNADLIAKKAIQAAVYVLQYYCQMTDPNISTAMLIRNAVKLSLSAASQIQGAFGQTGIPSELPLPLTPLALYSMAQLPINVFGVPPVGIGVGPPLTIPGMVLLGAEALLLSLEFAENLDSNIENKKIQEELKNYCFDLLGYKKYGIE